MIDLAKTGISPDSWAHTMFVSPKKYVWEHEIRDVIVYRLKAHAATICVTHNENNL